MLCPVKALCGLGAVLVAAGVASAQTPVVTTVATVDTAAEGGSTPGEVTFYRGGAMTGDLTIDFTAAGTAVQATDYTFASAAALTGTHPDYQIVVPDGAGSVTIDITPVDNDVQSIPFLTVTLTIVPNGAYSVGTPADATVTILDDDIYIAAFDLVAPAEAAFIEVDTANTFTWEPNTAGSAATVLYILVVATDAAFTLDVRRFNAGTSLTVDVFAGTFAYTTAYYWKVEAQASEGGGTLRDSTSTRTFTTLPDTISPRVLSTNPSDGENAFDSSAAIEITFSEPMVAATTLAAVSMRDEEGAYVFGDAFLSAYGRALAFQPLEDLAEGVTYTVRVAATAEDLGGNTLGMDYVFLFTTWPPAVTPFAGGCSGGGSKASGLALIFAATLSVLALFYWSFRRKERNMVHRMTSVVVIVTLSVLVFSAAREAEGATAEETPATSPAEGEAKPAVGPEGEIKAEPVAPVVPTTVPEIAPEPEVWAEPRTRRFGVRAGMFLPATVSDETYSKSFTAGAFYAGELPVTLGLAKLPFEVGVDFSRSDSDDGRVEAGFYALRLDLLFSKWESLYILGGYQIVLASLVVDGDPSDLEYVSAFNVGLGVGSSESRWDARVAYSILAGSGNIRGMIAATAGLRF